MSAPTPLDEDPGTGFLADETGARSTARLLLWVEMLVVSAQTTYALVAGKDIGNGIWSLHAGIIVALAAGAWGPRVAQYLAPQLSAFAGAVGSALTKAREPSKFDDHRDDSKK